MARGRPRRIRPADGLTSALTTRPALRAHGERELPAPEIRSEASRFETRPGRDRAPIPDTFLTETIRASPSASSSTKLAFSQTADAAKLDTSRSFVARVGRDDVDTRLRPLERAGNRTGIRAGSSCQSDCQLRVSQCTPTLPLNHAGFRCAPASAVCDGRSLTTPTHLRKSSGGGQGTRERKVGCKGAGAWASWSVLECRYREGGCGQSHQQRRP